MGQIRITLYVSCAKLHGALERLVRSGGICAQLYAALKLTQRSTFPCTHTYVAVCFTSHIMSRAQSVGHPFKQRESGGGGFTQQLAFGE